MKRIGKLTHLCCCSLVMMGLSSFFRLFFPLLLPFDDDEVGVAALASPFALLMAAFLRPSLPLFMVDGGAAGGGEGFWELAWWA